MTFELKKCVICGKEKNISDFTYNKTRKKYKNQCKECFNNNQRFKRQKNKSIEFNEKKTKKCQELELLKQGYIVCTKCENKKDISEFYFVKRNNLYDKRCRECKNKRERFLKKENKLDGGKRKRKSIKKKEQKKKLLENGLKRCSRCKKIKNINDFHKNKCYCKKCAVILDKEWNEKNLSEDVKNIIKNKEHEKFLIKQGYKKCVNCKEIKSLSAFYYVKKDNRYACYCKECSSIIGKEYNTQNNEQINIKKRINYLKNRISIIKDQNKRAKRRRKTDILFKMICRLRTAKSTYLKNIIKKHSTLELLKDDDKKLLEYLSNKFKGNMSFENYGKVWHLDHIVPITWFDLTSEVEQKICFHYLNLQPLFSLENIQKSNKIPPNANQILSNICQSISII